MELGDGGGSQRGRDERGAVQSERTGRGDEKLARTAEHVTSIRSRDRTPHIVIGMSFVGPCYLLWTTLLLERLKPYGAG